MALKNYIRKIIKGVFLSIAVLLILVTAALFILVRSYKTEMAEQLIVQLREYYGIGVRYEKLKVSLTESWPQLSFKFKNLSFTSLYENPRAVPMFTAGELFITVQGARLLKGEIVVEEIAASDGRIFLEKDSLGRKNFSLKPMPAGTAAPALFNVNRLALRNVRLDFYNRPRGKHIGLLFKRNLMKLKWFHQDVGAEIKGKVLVDELLFKPQKGPMFNDKMVDLELHTVFLRKQRRIFIDSTSSSGIDGQKYRLSGMIYLDSLQRIALRAATRSADFDRILELLTPKARKNLSAIRVKEPLDAEMKLVAKFNSDEDPSLAINFSGRNSTVYTGKAKIPYTNLSFRGELLCLPGENAAPDMEKAVLRLYQLQGRYHGFPFKGSVVIRNLNAPYLLAKALISIDSRKIKFKPGEDFDLNGYCYARIQYEGPVSAITPTGWLNRPMKLRGDLKIDGLTYKTKTSQLPFTLKGKAEINNKDVKFSDMSLRTIGGDFLISGRSAGFVSYVCGLQRGFTAAVEACAEDFDLNPLLENSRKKREDSDPREKNSRSGVSSNDFEFNMQVKIRRLLVKKLQGSGVMASIRYIDDVIHLQKLDLETCGGSIAASGFLYNNAKARASVWLKNVNVRTLFEQCSNFGQKAIVSENVLGTLSATTQVSLEFFDSFVPVPGSLALDTKAQLRDGHLINYEPIQKISSYIFRKRNFSDISFTEMRPVFTIRGNEMKIDTMEIASSVLNLYVSGTYNFKEESNLNIVVPWSNLKARDRNFEPARLSPDGELAKGLRLNVYGMPHQMKIRLGNHAAVEARDAPPKKKKRFRFRASKEQSGDD